MKDLSGKVVVVTGAGSGIGRAAATALADKGATVAVCDIDDTAAKETAERIRVAGGVASSHQVDVSSEADMRGLVDGVLATHGVVDVVVNNAGISTAPTRATDIDLDRFRRILEVNFWGCVYGSLFFLPHLLERPAANLVNVASNGSLMAYSRMAPYTSSKFAVRGFTETLRMELRSTPVRVTLVCPGTTKTSLMANSPVVDDDQRMALQHRFDKSWGSKPEKVGTAIVGAIVGDRPRRLVGPDSVLLDGIVRLLPAAYSRLLARGIDKFLDQIANDRR